MLKEGYLFYGFDIRFHFKPLGITLYKNNGYIHTTSYRIVSC